MSKKDTQLGIAHGTAANKLRKMLLFKYVTLCGANVCFRCGEVIDNIDNFTIDHKIPWLDSENPIELFLDLNNIGFSHSKCNIDNKRNPKRVSHHGRTMYDRGCRCPTCIEAKQKHNRAGHEKVRLAKLNADIVQMEEQ